MGCFGGLRLNGILAGCCLLGTLMVPTPLFCLDNTTAPGMPAPSVQTNVASPTEPKPWGQPPPEGLPGKSSDPLIARDRVEEALLQESFSYNQNKLVDPFISFISPVEVATAQPPGGVEDFEPPPEPQRPLTPLQKMNLGEIEKGLRAIVWGEFGRRAMVEDSAGRGYIVGIGTPAGERDGVITDIFNDRIVIQQQFWDRTAKRMMPQNFVVKLKKEKAK
jgi:Tfp pilus assembly protein PilP